MGCAEVMGSLFFCWGLRRKGSGVQGCRVSIFGGLGGLCGIRASLYSRSVALATAIAPHPEALHLKTVPFNHG